MSANKKSPVARRPSPGKLPAKEKAKKPSTQADTKFARNLKKLLSLIPILKANQGIKIKDLQKISGYTSEKKLHEDLEKLLFFGQPPFTPSDYIDIYIEDDRVFLEFPQGLDRPLALTPDEWTAVQALLEKEINFYSGGRKPTKHLRDIVLRMSQVPLAIEPGPFARKQSILMRAIDDSLQVEFQYRSLYSKEPEIRRIDPWAVFANQGTIYCLGYCHTRRSPRIFHLERMEKVEILNVKQEKAPSVQPVLNESFIFRKDKSGFSGEIEFDRGVRPALERTLDLKEIKKGAGGRWTAKVNIKDSHWFKAMIRSFGPYVKILSPDHLRQSFISELREIPVPEAFEVDGKSNS
ncbi:MAG TPA: WYL domain-containing protein [Leptospiraceae bacterium]|nr:WYL domain-containing protein [Leptospirales bacterium]HMU81700.1 WYL domain-containing protein [Leptospiraceae bacterium]HMW59503.1 WYL domain-containing protein [Leptospiraceae bacterium]HMX56530.1 WYL domain-containing protein [Leptospiraceae bacterium]HNE23748.1 WYL domain-containing protein [Leptospiraceae bacterium]